MTPRNCRKLLVILVLMLGVTFTSRYQTMPEEFPCSKPCSS